MAGRRNGDDYGAGGDFRRKPLFEEGFDDQAEEDVDPRHTEYIRALLSEKLALDREKFPLAFKYLDQEMTRAQAAGKGPKKSYKYVDIFHEKPALVSVKVLVPVKRFPKFNFVGKLLGPKGNSLKRLQDDTLCRMSILGRGSMRDRDKEEELRNSLETKYAHLTDDLHVEISALGPPAEAYARIAFALTEVQKYLVPDGADDISKGQLQEMGIYEERPPRRFLGPPPGVGGGSMRRPPGSRGEGPSRPSASHFHPGSKMHGSSNRGMPGKSNAMSFLERTRAAREENYEREYEEPYEPESLFNNYASPGPSRSGFGGNRMGVSDYDTDFYADSSNDYSENQRWKPYKSGGPPTRPDQPRFRSTPYGRPGK